MHRPIFNFLKYIEFYYEILWCPKVVCSGWASKIERLVFWTIIIDRLQRLLNYKFFSQKPMCVASIKDNTSKFKTRTHDLGAFRFTRTWLMRDIRSAKHGGLSNRLTILIDHSSPPRRCVHALSAWRPLMRSCHQMRHFVCDIPTFWNQRTWKYLVIFDFYKYFCCTVIKYLLWYTKS